MSPYQPFDPNAFLARLPQQTGEVSHFSDFSKLSPDEYAKWEAEWSLLQMQYEACIEFRVSPEHQSMTEAMLKAEAEAVARLESRLLALRRLLGR